jgi:hypothetical protein
MLPPTRHPDEIPVQRLSRPETQPSRTAGEGQADHATSDCLWPLLWRAQRESSGVRARGTGLWQIVGGILLLVGVITFFRYLAAAQVAGGCCGGELVMLAGLNFLVIGLRDRGEFSS